MFNRHKRRNQEIFEEQVTTNFVLDLLDRCVLYEGVQTIWTTDGQIEENSCRQSSVTCLC